MVETLLAFNYRDIVKAIFKKFDPATTRQLLKIRNKRNSTERLSGDYLVSIIVKSRILCKE